MFIHLLVNLQQEWQHQLRSSLHPAVFGLVYKGAHELMSAVLFPPQLESLVLVVLPKIVQSVFAALSDFYTWRLATGIFGRASNVPWAAVSCYVVLSSFGKLTGSNTALDDGPQPLAMVLLHQDLLQLARDHLDHCCALLLAVGAPCRCQSVHDCAIAVEEQR